MCGGFIIAIAKGSVNFATVLACLSLPLCLQANVRSEVGKLVRRLCVLLRVEEADYDHFSLYVEGTPYTILPEVWPIVLLQ